MEYSKIITVLKRYTFEEKMRISYRESSAMMTPNGLADLRSDKLCGSPLPWEMETFAMFSIMADEWGSNSFFGKGERVFGEIINAIRNFIHPSLNLAEGTAGFTKWFLIVTGATQFDIQEYYPYKMFRYYYYFTFVNDKINMQDLFKSRFGSNYYDYLVFAQFLWYAICSKKQIKRETLNYWYSEHKEILNSLCITREEYQNQLRKITTDINDYQYCLRPSYTFPFLQENNTVYLPLPHLLIRSVTSSLLYRLTENDNALADVIGKEVLESYLYEIIKDSNEFDEVLPEQEINMKGGSMRTPDVMARKDDYYVFFDSKFYAPKRDLRLMRKETLNETIDRLADKVVQVYKHVRTHFPAKYNFFVQKPEVHDDKKYGLVVVREDPHVRPNLVYNKAAEELKIEIDSVEFDWLCTHIGIVDVASIEDFCFSDSDFVEAVQQNGREGHTQDFWLQGNRGTRITSERVNAFKKKINDDVIAATKPMVEIGAM